MLRLIAGFEKPDSGDIHLGDVNLKDLLPHRRGCGMVFQNYALFPHMTVFENLAFSLELKGVRKKELRERVYRALDSIGLTSKAGSIPAELSGGQQQRVAQARTLLSEPALLLFDEPLSNLDVKLRCEMREEIRRIQKRADITALYVTHDQEEAMVISDRIAVMRDGRIEQTGTGRDIYHDPASIFVASFVGMLNIVDGRIVEKREDACLVRFWGDTYPVTGGTGELAGEVKVCIRPEAMRLVPVPDSSVTGVILEGVYYGARTVFRLSVDGGEVLVEERSRPGRVLPGTGEQVGVAIREDSIRLLQME